MRKLGKSASVKSSSRRDCRNGSCVLTLPGRRVVGAARADRPDASTVHEPTLLFLFFFLPSSSYPIRLPCSSDLVPRYHHVLIDHRLLYPLEFRSPSVGANALVDLLCSLYIELGSQFSLSFYFPSHVVSSDVGLYRPQMPRQSSENTKLDFFPLYSPPGAFSIQATESIRPQYAPYHGLFERRLYDYDGTT
jgi:hypothetical protein